MPAGLFTVINKLQKELVYVYVHRIEQALSTQISQMYLSELGDPNKKKPYLDKNRKASQKYHQQYQLEISLTILARGTANNTIIPFKHSMSYSCDIINQACFLLCSSLCVVYRLSGQFSFLIPHAHPLELSGLHYMYIICKSFHTFNTI